MNDKGASMVAIAVIIAILIYASAYIVDERQQVVITQFGEVIGETKKEPGLKFKMPWQNANYFPKNLQEWNSNPGQIPTLDKTYIWVDTFARWKIVDAVKFFQTVNNVPIALGRLDDIIDPAARNFITSHRLIEAVRKSNRQADTTEIGLEDFRKEDSEVYKIQVGREKITEGILKQAQPKLDKFGIELVDVKIKRINYVEKVRESVYDRMIAERKQIAAKFRSEGQGEARKITGEKERELKRITSEAYRSAQEIMGTADAEAAAISAEAYGPDPEFYSFIKTLELYNKVLGENSSLVLSTDSELLKYLKGYGNKP